jgi:hypothetical protein
MLDPVTFVMSVMAHCKAIYLRPGDIRNVWDGPLQGNIYLDSVTFVMSVMPILQGNILRPGDIRNVWDGPLQNNIS